jgi:3-hydroxybutyryl-CoA dehydrogenase
VSVQDRVLTPMLRDAERLAADGVAAPGDIDLAMRLGARHATGPLELLTGSAPEASQDGAAAEGAGLDGPVVVVGSGFMASGIAYAAAVAGVPVTVVARTDAAAAASRARIDRDLDAAVARGRLTEDDAAAARDRLTSSTDRDAVADTALVIEAVAEDLDVKREVFADLDRRADPATVLATNTSSLRVQDVARDTAHPERVAALHFFSPVPAMKLVEVVGADAVAAPLAAWARRIGKVPVCCEDRNGFVVNRLLIPMLNDAVRYVDDGLGTVEEVDDALPRLGGHPIGPFALLDLIGLDISLAAQQAIADAEPTVLRLRPATGLVARVRRGDLGRKTGRGFHGYEG